MKMNFFDIVTFAALVWGVIRGLRSGFVSQLFSIIGIVFGLMLAVALGEEVGQMMGIDKSLAYVAGFIIVFAVSLIAATIAAHLAARIIKSVGLGRWDTVLGVVLSCVKMTVLLGVIYATIDAMNREMKLFDTKHTNKSLTFNFVRSTARPAFRYIDEARKSIVEAKPVIESAAEMEQAK